MNEETKVIGTIFDSMLVNGKLVIYVELPDNANFNYNDKIEITLVEKGEQWS